MLALRFLDWYWWTTLACTALAGLAFVVAIIAAMGDWRFPSKKKGDVE